MGGKLTNDGLVLLCYIAMNECYTIISSMPDIQTRSLNFISELLTMSKIGLKH